MGVFPTHVPALLIGKKGFKSQTGVNDTYLDGAAVDRLGARSALAVVLVRFTSGSGDATGRNTLTVKVEHDSAAAFNVAKATLKTYAKTLAWAADGANEIYAFLPLDLSMAKRYVRVSAKCTKAGTVTITNQEIAAALILCGLEDKPASGYNADGYALTVEPAAG